MKEKNYSDFRLLCQEEELVELTAKVRRYRDERSRLDHRFVLQARRIQALTEQVAGLQ